MHSDEIRATAKLLKLAKFCFTRSRMRLLPGGSSSLDQKVSCPKNPLCATLRLRLINNPDHEE